MKWVKKKKKRKKVSTQDEREVVILQLRVHSETRIKLDL